LAEQENSTHTIHAQDGGLVEVKHYAPRRAIKAFCTECLAWEGDPADGCTSPNGSLYPYRGRSMVAWRSHSLRRAPESSGFRKKGEAKAVECPESRNGYQNGHGDAEAHSYPANPRISAGEDDMEEFEMQQSTELAGVSR
jgi:hypothetical protein